MSPGMWHKGTCLLSGHLSRPKLLRRAVSPHVLQGKMLSRESASRSHTAENRATSIAVRKVQGVYHPDGLQEQRVESHCRGSVWFLLFRKLDIQSNIR